MTTSGCVFPAAALLAWKRQVQAQADAGDYAAALTLWRIERLRKAHSEMCGCNRWNDAIKEMKAT